MTELEEQTPDEEPVEPTEDDGEALEEGEQADNEPAEGEPEPAEEEGAPVDHVSMEEIERVSKALDRATNAYVKKLVDVLGPELGEFHSCPLCADAFPGIRLAVMPAPETVAAVKAEIGEPADPPLQADEFSKPCESCGGWGNVSTGSHVRGQEKAQCVSCKGRGWVALHQSREQGVLPPPENGANGATIYQEGTQGAEPPAVADLRSLGYIVVPPPEVVAT